MNSGRFRHRDPQQPQSGWEFPNDSGTGEATDGAADRAAGRPPEGAPLGGTRAEASRRLQIGLSGLGAMVLLIGLADVLGSQADLAEESAVPDAAPTTEPTEAAPQRDPLADAGIVPDMPEPSPTPSQPPPAAPSEQSSPQTVPDSPVVDDTPPR